MPKRKCLNCYHVKIREALIEPAEMDKCLYSDSEIKQGDINPANNEHLAEICDYYDNYDGGE